MILRISVTLGVICRFIALDIYPCQFRFWILVIFFFSSFKIIIIFHLFRLELLVADDETSTSEEQTDDNQEANGSVKPVPSILISGQELSNSLLMSVGLQFGDDLWAIVWEKSVDTKLWQIEARNIDALNLQPPILLYEIVKRALLQLLFTITIDECYQASLLQTQINCTNSNFIPSMRADIVKPLVKSFIANETDCVHSEFFVENFERVEMSENFQEIVMKQADSANIINFEVKLCH